MVVATDLFHMMDPSGAPQNVNFDEPVGTFDSRWLLDLLLTPTKGNVIVGDGANWIILGVGADTEVLTADSGEVSGVKWDAAGGGGADEKVKVSVNDTTPGYLDAKLVAGANIILTEIGDGGDEDLSIAADNDDEKAKVSADDTTPGYLNGKLIAGDGVIFTENDGGGDETLTIDVVGGDVVGGDHVHGLTRWNADGGATYDLPDIAEYLELVFDDGSLVDPSTLALSADGSQIVFDVAPAVASVVVVNYVILRM